MLLHHSRKLAICSPLYRFVSAYVCHRRISLSFPQNHECAQVIVKTPTDKEKEIASNWPTWGCGVSKFPWSYDSSETCLILEVHTSLVQTSSLSSCVHIYC